ncbi:caspase, EACC1-associated type [Longispora albida]|uniref:caspase, EACC1-associated type n=1 Tax=Longispora albida TaxID=203523 RepID=UPI0003749869|nr:caspase family protein [Longispora albida]
MSLGSAGSRILLAGTGTHVAGSPLPPVPAVERTVWDLAGALAERCGVRPGNLLTPVLDPTPIELGTALTRAAAQAEDVLLFYYVGHGLVSPGNKLHLATRETSDLSTGLAYTSLPYSAVEDALTACRARTILVVLDCCFAGRAHGSFGTAATDAFELAALGGTYVLASASASERALAPVGDKHTAFTGALLTLLREGDPGGLPDLTVEGAYRYLRRELPKRGIPAPARHLSGHAGDLVLAPNPAARPPAVPPVAAGLPPVTEQPCPYRGLDVFTADDTRYFFGREELTGELLSHVTSRSQDGHPIAVLGLSGVGKSSLLRAGLLAAAQRGELRLPGSGTWPQLVITPGDRPLDTLAHRLAGLARTTPEAIRAELDADPARLTAIVRHVQRQITGGRDVPGGRLLLVVDQFEELFTVCQDEEERRKFILAIRAVAGDAALVVFGIRSDFYAHCLAHPDLAPALQDRPFTVPAMTLGQMRDTIEGPAQAAGLRLEPGLVDLLLHDLRMGSGFGAGALPLLSYALLLTWQARQYGTLTAAGYQATGGVWGAVTHQADTVYSRLDATGQRAMRLMLLRMVSVGDGTEDTRRRVDLAELAAEIPGVAFVRDQLAGARLITVDGDTAQISHEALLRAWPMLRGWLDADRAGLVIQQKLSEAAASWERGGREASSLYGGTQLQLAQVWAADMPDQLSPLNREFLGASVRAQRRRRRVRGSVVVALASLLVLSLVAMSAAVKGRDDALEQQRAATARALIDRAGSAIDTAPQLSLRLGIAAARLHSGPETTTGLLSSLMDPYAGTLSGHTAPVAAVEFSPDGKRLATSGMDKRILLWDPLKPGRPLGEITSAEAVQAMAFSPDGNALITVNGRGLLALWDITDPANPSQASELAGPARMASAATLSADGTVLAAGMSDGTVRLWNIADHEKPSELASLPVGTTDFIDALAFSPDGRLLVAGGYDRNNATGISTRVWDVRDTRRPREVSKLDNQGEGVGAIAFSPDGRILATGKAHHIVLWNITDPAKPAKLSELTEQSSPVRSIRFEGKSTISAAGYDHSWMWWDITDPAKPGPGKSQLVSKANWTRAIALSPDGEQLATAAVDNTVTLWRSGIDTGFTRHDKYLGDHDSAVRAVQFCPGRPLLATATAGGVVNLWDVTDLDKPRGTTGTKGHKNMVDTLAFSPDGRTLTTGDEDGVVILWDVTDPGKLRERTRFTVPARPAGGLAYDRDGRVLAVGTGDGTVSLWNVTEPDRPRQLGSVAGGKALVPAVAFSPDGRTLATASYDGTGSLWDVTRPAAPSPLALLTGHTGQWSALAFSPDGSTLATGSQDSTVILWDVHDPRRPRVRGAPLTGQQGTIRSLAFSPDGWALASGSADQSTRAWDVVDPGRPRSLIRIRTQAAIIIAVAFSPDGRTLATAGADKRVYLWDLGDIKDTRANAVKKACERAGRGLNEAEWRQHVPDLPYQKTCP